MTTTQAVVILEKTKITRKVRKVDGLRGYSNPLFFPATEVLHKHLNFASLLSNPFTRLTPKPHINKSTMASASSVLGDLLEYSNASQAGNDALKSSMWQITKLRRKQNRGMLSMEEHFSAEQIREELRARTLVKDCRGQKDAQADEPDLVPEGDATSTSISVAPTWKAVDAVEERAATKENNANEATTSGASSSGLRQRKNNPGESSSTNKQALGEVMKEDPVIDEEEELLLRDPLELFAGVRPSDLKAAQTSAKEALDFYIQAANQAAKILAQLNLAKKTNQ